MLKIPFRTHNKVGGPYLLAAVVGDVDGSNGVLELEEGLIGVQAHRLRGPRVEHLAHLCTAQILDTTDNQKNVGTAYQRRASR